MDRETRTRLGAQLAGYVATGTTYDAGRTVAVPTTVYTDEARWRLERGPLLRRNPTVVALSGALRQAGDFVTFDNSVYVNFAYDGADSTVVWEIISKEYAVLADSPGVNYVVARVRDETVFTLDRIYPTISTPSTSTMLSSPSTRTTPGTPGTRPR